MRDRLTGPKMVQILVVMVVLSAAFWLRTCGTEQQTTENVEEKLDYCDVSHNECRQEQGGLIATARLKADKLQAESPFELNITFSDPSVTVVRSVLEGETMYMGTLPALLQPAGKGRWQGQALVGSCTEARMLWAWVVEVEYLGQPQTYRFLFEVRH
ncbi:hypothetical protein [Oceanimonas doudoroffii]|uniref:YtkA-like domain-containing protein n=1 Tax=Oceanimonas doudoroffii TaxID=84158 RepID=A0A233RGJ2_9GAMM|nr:hypothetical protein [Oceanimonas doudoroffii]OXY82504.1 hypothetical protein B6S08_02980 [Oceanimonas doudoroffii]